MYVLLHTLIIMPKITLRLLERNTNMIIKSIEEFAKQNDESHRTIHDIIKNGGKL